MIIRPKLNDECRQFIEIARGNFTAYSLLDDGDLLSVLLSAAARPYAYALLDFVQRVDAGTLEFLPAGLGDLIFILKGGSYEELYHWDTNPRDEVTYEGKVISSREMARIKLRKYVLDFDTLMAVLHTAWVDMKDPTKIHYYENTRVGWRVRTVSVAKFLNMLNRKHGFRFPKEEIERIATRFGTEYRKPEYTFELSHYVYDTYNEEGFGSCMYGSESVYFYDDQENVQVLRILKENGELAGRALVWSNVRRYDSNGRLLDSDLTVMDRIYPSDEGYHIRAAIDYANEQGWVNKEEQSVGGEFSLPGMYEVDIYDIGYYPYVDSFSYSTMYHDKLMCWRRAEYLRDEEDEEIYVWHSTEGYEPELA